MLAEEKQPDIRYSPYIFRHILVAIDFSPASKHAICMAASLADRDADITLLHVKKTDWRYEMLESPPELDL
jgi:nucleotide-binding universal stress UspA family protein